MGKTTSVERVIGHRFIVGMDPGDLLGRGAMGDVYRAKEVDSGKKVAVKVLRPELVEPEGEPLTRFVREGEALRQLNHPNIVNYIDAVVDQPGNPNDPSCFLVMEYVDGGSLRDLLRREKRLPIQDALSIGLALADALTFAHRLGIIHRDIKPGNVLIDREGTPLLGDFGLAHIRGSSSLTKAGTVMGTVEYLSPEACNGEYLDEAADIWSLGIMLFEMVTGTTPFRRDNMGATLAAILAEPCPDLCQHRPEAPESLALLVNTMLHKEPQERPASMRQVSAELELLIRRPESISGDSESRLSSRSFAGSGEITLGPTDPEAVDTWSAGQALQLIIARCTERGDSFLGRPSLAFAYTVQENLRLDDDSAAFLLKSALIYDEPVTYWLESFTSSEKAVTALRAFYDTYPRPEIRERIVDALAGLDSESAEMILLHISAHDDTPVVKTRASLAAAGRGYEEVATIQALEQARESGDSAAMATLTALVDRYGLPQNTDWLMRLQITVSLSRHRWRTNRRAIWQQARRTAAFGSILGVVMMLTPPLMAATEPASYEANMAFPGLGSWLISLAIGFGLFGLFQGFATGSVCGLVDALRLETTPSPWRALWSSIAGLVYFAFISAFMLFNDTPIPTPSWLYLPVNLLISLIFGVFFSLVTSELGSQLPVRLMARRMVVFLLVATLLNAFYTRLVFGQLDDYIFWSRSLIFSSLFVSLALASSTGRRSKIKGAAGSRESAGADS